MRKKNQKQISREGWEAKLDPVWDKTQEYKRCLPKHTPKGTTPEETSFYTYFIHYLEKDFKY